ncbi:conserved hypothetical protein [Phenylobacterium zucineum HLK1]|uniref:Tail specific protease domain-containing protein n=1 Tax=Phenylobacterium zucineum (strain HLK1) TaxID=450851 RepID=B4REU8_PHEZH|nr:S41 family peptidase [Phenylobacterium zucineum]ACG78624.1 conserved hypothetical protein [Phenylobacterium zucineum HLK1]
MPSFTRRRSLALLAAAGAAPAAAGRAARAQAPDPAGLLPAEAVRADLRHLYETLEAGHYDLFAHRSRAEYEAQLARLTAGVDRPLTRREAAGTLQKLAAYGRIGHARLEAPAEEFVAHIRAGGTFLPIFVRVDGTRVRLTRTADAAGELAAGTELLSIEGEPAHAWLERLGAYVSAERPYMAHAQMEQSFPALLWVELGERDALTVTVRGPEGAVVRRRVAAVTYPQLGEIGRAHPTPRIGADFNAREVRLLGDGIAYLRPGPFMNTAADAAGPSPSYEDSAYRAFLDAAFGTILTSGASDLIVDLRDNPGGDNSFSDAMVAWFADRPFRFASRFMLKASAPTKAWYARQRAEDPAPDRMLARLMAAEAAQPNGVRYAFEIPLTPPRAGPRYEGRVWALVNRHSYSNATSVAALIQDYGFGTVLGEETADVPTTYASTVHFELPHTGYSVSYPKSWFVRPSGDETLRGVVPDTPLARQPIGDAEDRMLAAAVAHVRETRPR